MSERSLISNGRFLHDIDNWTFVGAEYSAGDGDDHYGIAVLDVGDYISQTFSVPHLRAYSVHLDAKPMGGDLSSSKSQIIITDGDGNTVAEIDLTGTDAVWTANETEIGLAPGTSYTLKIINNSFSDGALRIDDVWIYGLIISRSEIASRVADKLGRLGTERSLSASASGSKTEGDFTYSIDKSLRDQEMINPETGLPDIRYLNSPGDVGSVLSGTIEDMLEGLEMDYAVETDLKVGPRSESRSQIAGNISKMRSGGAGGSGKRVVSRKFGNK